MPTSTPERNIYADFTAPEGGLYLKLQDKQPVRLRIASEPYFFQDEYQGRVSRRYAWVVWNHETDTAQVLQLPVTAFKMVQALGADPQYGDPTEYDITIMRSGTAKKTEYRVTPARQNTPLSDEAKAAVAEVSMKEAIPNAIGLAAFFYDKQPLPEPVSRATSDDDGPTAADREASGNAPQGKQAHDTAQSINLDDIPF